MNFRNPVTFFKAMLLTPLPVLGLVALVGSGEAADIAKLGLMFGGAGYAAWAAIGFRAPKSNKQMGIWLGFGPLSYWLLNLPFMFATLAIMEGYNATDISLLPVFWLVGGVYAIPIAYAFVASWLILWLIIRNLYSWQGKS